MMLCEHALVDCRKCNNEWIEMRGVFYNLYGGSDIISLELARKTKEFQERDINQLSGESY